MEITTKLQPYRIEKQCDNCKIGLMEKTGHAVANMVGTRYEHKCSKCGFKEEYYGNYYPRVIYEEAVNLPPKKNKYDIADKDGTILPRHSTTGKPRTYEQATYLVDRLNKNGEYKPYKLVPICPCGSNVLREHYMTCPTNDIIYCESCIRGR